MKITMTIVIFAAAALTATPAAQARGSHSSDSHSYSSRSSGYGTGSHSVRGYTKRDGTSVRSHHATNRNGTKRDNWTTKGNVNPYTGKPGTVDPNKR